MSMRTGLHAEISTSPFGVTLVFPNKEDIKQPHLRRLALAGFERLHLMPRHFLKRCTPLELPAVEQQAQQMQAWLADPENGRERLYRKRKAA